MEINQILDIAVWAHEYWTPNIEHDVKCVDLELEKPMKPILNQFHYEFKL